MLKRDLVKGEFVCVKISGTVVLARVIDGGSKNIAVQNLVTGRQCNLKTLKAVRSIVKTV